MFSQQNKATKLAWLESDSSKPLNDDNGGQVGRNLFDLYSDRRSPSDRQDHQHNHHQNYQNQQQRDTRIAFGPGQHQARIQSGPGGGRTVNQQRPISQASFMTHSNITSDDDDNYDEEDHLQQDKGSLRKLHRRPASAGTSASTATTPAAIKSGSKWPSLGSESATPTDCEDNNNNQSKRDRGSLLDRLCLCLWRILTIMGLLITLGFIVYFWPIDSRLEFEARVAPFKPRPKFTGPLAINSHLDTFAEKLYENQFHAPESMAWTADKRAFFTGVEGGFILLVEPYADRWTVAARLNARSSVEDRSKSVKFRPAANSGDANATETSSSSSSSNGAGGAGRSPALVPYCERDIQLYGPRAEFEPSRVKLSRCSRPLGIRLAPDGSRLYVADPLSGLYRIELAANLSQALGDRARPLHKLNRVIKLMDFAKLDDDNNEQEQRTAGDDRRPTRPDQVYFGDDIAVNFNAAEANGNDLIYLTDCSRRWSLRYLFWLMLENDDSGRILRFDVGQNELSLMGNIVPVNLDRTGSGGLVTTGSVRDTTTSNTQLSDERGLSFPNGLELTADKSGLLISDLNNRRILRHHLSGQRQGTTELVMWVPGYSDNIRRGLDEPDGTPTYWFACGCAVSDNKHEIAEMFNEYPSMKRLLLRWLHVFGTIVGSLGQLFDSTALKDAGLLIDAAWLKVDPYCTHGLVAQFNEQGEILRSLHGPSFSSNYKLLSEAHQVPLLQDDLPANGASSNNNNNSTTTTTQTTTRSQLYLGSVYYSYLGRIDLSGPEQMEAAAKSAKPSVELEAKDAFGNRVAN